MEGRDGTTPTRRNRTLDGVRGYAIVLVVLSHGWILWPTQDLYARTWSRVWFTSGNAAVSVFLAVGFFLLTSAILDRIDRDAAPPAGRILLRRLIRLGGQTYALLLLVVVVTTLDSTSYEGENTPRSLLHIATFTWNWYLHDHSDVARPDLGHLWYLSVDLQMLVVVLLLLWLLRHHPVRRIAWLAGILVLMWWWRHHAYDVEPAGVALRTWARGDAAVAGALAAACLRYLRPLADQVNFRTVAAFSAVALPVTFTISSDLGWYFGLGGILLDLNLMAFVIGCTLAAPPGFIRLALENRSAVTLGKYSLGLYLWHYPVFWYVSTRNQEMDWIPKTMLAVAATALLAVLAHVYVERRVQHVLDAAWWRRPTSKATPGATSAPASDPSEPARSDPMVFRDEAQQ